MKRQADEKLEIMQKVYSGEEKRNIWLQRISIFFIISIVLLIVLLRSNIIYLLIGIVVVIIICSCLVYRAFQFTIIVPIVVTEADLGKI